eukprot:881-Heterococcus_DN1.PRE.6
MICTVLALLRSLRYCAASCYFTLLAHCRLQKSRLTASRAPLSCAVDLSSCWCDTCRQKAAALSETGVQSQKSRYSIRRERGQVRYFTKRSAMRAARAVRVLLACVPLVAPSAVEVGVASYAVARHKRTHDERTEAAAPAPASEQHGVVQRAVRHHQAHASQVVSQLDVQPSSTQAATTESSPRNVLILMSDTGGGHRASAEALKAAFAILYPGQFNISIMDIWTEYGAWPFDRLVQNYRRVYSVLCRALTALDHQRAPAVSGATP